MKNKLIFVWLVLLLAVVGTSASDQAGPQSAPNTLKPYLVSISVSNLDETIKWYHDNLGFTVINRKDLPKLSLRIAFIQANGFVLELIEFKNSVSEEAIRKKFPNVDDRAKVQGFGKLAFQVNDVVALAKLLRSNGVHFVRDVEQDDEIFHTKWFIVIDNSGNWIQFFQTT